MVVLVASGVIDGLDGCDSLRGLETEGENVEPENVTQLLGLPYMTVVVR